MPSDQEKTGNPLWSSWIDALGATATPLSVYESFFERWRSAAGFTGANQPDEARSAGEGPISARAAELFQSAFSGGTQSVLRMTEAATEAMRRAVPTNARSAADRLVTNPALEGLALWMEGATQYQKMANPWADLMQQSFGSAAAMGGPAGAGDPLGAALERSFGLLVDFPGLNQELPALLREAADNWITLQRAREQYRAVMAGAWQRTFEEVTRELLRRAAGNPVESPGALLSLSTEVADRVFLETFRSVPYLEAQQKLSDTLALARQCEAKVIDLFARAGHFTTRREHDEALREISTLRRDVLDLKRALRASRGATQAVNPAPEKHQNGSAVLPTENGAKAKPRRRAADAAARGGKGHPKRTDLGK
jgi:hypothetical protein